MWSVVHEMIQDDKGIFLALISILKLLWPSLIKSFCDLFSMKNKFSNTILCEYDLTAECTG